MIIWINYIQPKKSASKNSETIVRCNNDVGQRAARNSRWLARKFLEMDDSVDWPGSSAVNSESLCTLRFRIVHGKNQWKSRKRMEGKIVRFMNSSQCRELDRIDGEPMEFEWKNFQDSLHCRFSPRSRTWWLKHRVNPCNSQDGLSSCQCLTTLYGEKKERRMECCEFPSCSRLCEKIRAGTLVVSWAWIREGMVRNSYVQTAWKMGSSRWGHDAQLQWKRTSRISWIRCFRTRRFEKQSKKKIVYTLLWTKTQQNWFFARSSPSISSVSTEQQRHVRRAALQNLLLFRTYRRTCCSEQPRNHCDSNRIVDNEQIASDQWQRARTLAAQLRAKNRTSSRSSSNDQTVLQCGYHEDRSEGQYFTTLDDAELDKLGGSCREFSLLRDNAATKVKRMDPWEHEDRSSFGGGSRSSSRPLRNRDHDRILIWWWNLFLWMEKTNTWRKWWRKPERTNIDYIGDCTGKPVAQARPKQTSMMTTSSSTATFPCHLRDWIDVGTRSVWQELFRSVKKDDQIASTRSFSTSRRRWGSRIQNLGTDVLFRISVFATLVNSNMAELLAKRRRS